MISVIMIATATANVGPEAVIPSLVNASVMSDKTRHFFTVKIGEKDVSRRIGELCVHFIGRPADM